MDTTIIKPIKPFTQICNERIIDKSINDESYRLLSYIEMQSENRKFYKNEIKDRFWRWDKKYLKAMSDLKEKWYIKHYPVRGDNWVVLHRKIELIYDVEQGLSTHPFTTSS